MALLALLVLFPALPVPAADGDSARLLWRVEDTDGTVLSEQGGTTPFNPASVIKVGTALLALERLGPDHRYQTAFAAAGRLDPASGRLQGDLLVEGGADPDFQLENAWLAARELNRLHMAGVSGDLVVAGTFWMGWEQGVRGRKGTTAGERTLAAGRRLREAWDPARWSPSTRRAWREWLARRGEPPSTPPPAVRIEGRVRLGRPWGRVVLRHLSNPLALVLKRFLVYSNNDIIRIAEPLGGAKAVEKLLTLELCVPPGSIRVGTASGEEHNAMTPRQVTALLHRFRDALAGHGLEPGDVLPVPGCDPGPVPRMFSHFARGPLARTLACKTGTLDTTDGGVAVLAGYATTRRAGPVVFVVAAPRAGTRLHHWRRVEQHWLESLFNRLGGAVQKPCPAPFPYSDSSARVLPVPPPATADPPGPTADGAPGRAPS